MKQSQILHVSVCGEWCRIRGRFDSNDNTLIGNIRENVLFKGKHLPFRNYWENGAKHPARGLDYITAEEWLILN